MEFDVAAISVSIDQTEGVNTEPLHKPERARYGSIRHDPHHHVHGLRGEADKIPEIIKKQGQNPVTRILNDTTRAGWVYDGMTFVPSEASKRPRMAFVIFTREVDLPAE